jgi:hypothetical protein
MVIKYDLNHMYADNESSLKRTGTVLVGNNKTFLKNGKRTVRGVKLILKKRVRT